MRKLTHLKKVVSLAVAAAMAVSVCTTALADDSNPAVKQQQTTSQEGDGNNKESEESSDISTHGNTENEFAVQTANEQSEAVAKTDDGTTYSTLVEAVAAVSENGTVTLLKSSVGSGVGIYTNASNGQIASKSFTIDFAGFTYTLNHPAVGSSGYETQAFHLERKADGTAPNITFKNGTINAKEDCDQYLQMLVQSYSSLTLDNMVLDGTNLHNLAQGNYTMSNNFGTSTFKNTKIIAKENGVAFDVCTWNSGSTHYDNTSVTIEGNSVISGPVELSNYNDGNAKLEITGGTFNDGFRLSTGAEKVKVSISGGAFNKEPDAKYIASGYQAVKSDNVWNVQKIPAAATIDSVEYATLAEAFTAVNSGKTVVLQSDRTESVTIPAGTEFTLDLNGKTLTNEAGKHTIENNGKLTVTGNGTVDNVSHRKGALMNNPGAAATLNGGTFTRSAENGINSNNNGGNSWYTICNKGALTVNEGVTVNQGADGKGKYSSLVCNEDDDYKKTAAPHCDLTINGGTFCGGLNVIKNGENGYLTINGGTFTSFAQSALLNWHVAEVKGGVFDGSGANAATVLNGQYDPDTGKGELKITGGTFIAGNKPFLTVMLKAYGFGTVEIAGGKFQGTLGDVQGSEDYANKLTVSGGYFTNEIVSTYITDGKYCNKLETKYEDTYAYQVGEKQEVEAKPEVVVKEPEVKAPAADAKIEETKKADATEVASKTQFDTTTAAGEKPEDNQTSSTLDKARDEAIQETVTEETKAKAEEKYADEVGALESEMAYVVMPYLEIEPKAYSEAPAADGTILTLDITPKYDLVLTTKDIADAAKADPSVIKTEKHEDQNAVTVAESRDMSIKAGQDVRLSIEVNDTVKAALQNKDIFILHDHEGKKFLYEAQMKGNTITFVNPNGFSDFSVLAIDPATAVKIDFETIGEKTYNMNAVSAMQEFPAATKAGYTFKGWKIGDKTVTNMSYDLWTALSQTEVNKATAVFEKNAEDNKSGSAAESTATPAPTAAPAASGTGYYTCKACGYHDWTATAEGYKCNHCGYVESVKQLSGYKNVKGVYEPKTSTTKAAKTTAVIPQTSDEMPIVPIAIIAVAALLGLGVTVVLKKKNKQ